MSLKRFLFIKPLVAALHQSFFVIKLSVREMKNLSRFLTAILCFAPFCVNAAGPVATTAGSNLTAFNPSTAYNNQWATMSNGRYDGNNTSAKADFGNCNAVVLRCAQPKCGNGGCTDASVASAIVTGCVQSNENCKQYGNDLVQYMTAQLVASSTAKVNEQNAAAQQAAAAAAAQQSQQQMAAMQQQVQQMQLQMQQQQAESQQQIQAALAQQAAQSAAAIESMKSAATSAAMENEAGISAYQQDAINRGISADILERQKITGQVMTELENAEVQLKELKTVMNTAFEYAGCDPRGNNCTGPKRVKKWRELALEFLNPYDETINNVYDALELAQLVGVDLSDIYMMLNNSCNRWGQYMCPKMAGGDIVYSIDPRSKGQKGVPYVCPGLTTLNRNMSGGRIYSMSIAKCSTNEAKGVKGVEECYKEALALCQPCTLLKVLSSGEDVYEGWVNAESDTNNGNATVVACASGALDSSALFARRTKNRNGAGLVDIDKLDVWLNQKEPNKTKSMTKEKMMRSCNVDGYIDVLQKAVSSKNITKGSGNSYAFCVDLTGDKDPNLTSEDSDCGYISPIYAICDTHQFNAGFETLTQKLETNDEKIKRCDKICEGNNSCEGKTDIEKKALIEECKLKPNESNHVDSGQVEIIKEIIGLKTTVISQQMYKQYEYLSATLRRLKTQLEKATLTAKLQAAGAKDDESSSSGLLGGGSSKTSQYENCSGKDIQEAIYCLRQNYNALAGQVNNKKCNANIKKQIAQDLKILSGKIPGDEKLYKQISSNCQDSNKITDCSSCLEEYSNGLNTLDDVRLDREARRSGRYRD